MPAGDKVIKADNRSFTYGDSLFETILIRNGLPVFFDAHFARLTKGAALLQIDMKDMPGINEVKEMIAELLKLNQLSDTVIRWQVFRGGSGLFDTGRPGFAITTRPLPSPAPAEGIKLCFYRDARKISDKFSAIKHGNYLPYSMGALHARNHNFDDAIILNQENRICDSCLANVFMLRNGEIFTPAISEGCVEGIFRQYLINILQAHAINIKETQVTEEMLNQAEEIFLTNSIRRIIPVGKLEEKSLPVTETKKIAELLKGENA